MANSPALRELDIALSELDKRIRVAKENNQKAIYSAVFSPVVAALLDLDNLTRSSAPNAPVTLFNNPWATLAAAIGVPLFQTLLGGNPAQQSRQIAISDLETRVEQLRRNRRELEERVRDTVTAGILDLERLTLEENQANRRLEAEQKRQKIRELRYRRGEGSTVEYLSQLERLESLTLQAELARKIRSTQLQKVTRHVLGSPTGSSPSLGE